MGDSSSHYLPAIYDAALGDEHWPRALDLLSREIGSVGAILISVDLVGLPFHIQQACSRYGVGRVRHYFDTFGHYDEPALGPTLALMPPLKLLRDCDVWGDITLLQDRPDYKWLREEIGACRKSAVRLSRNNGSLDLLALQFDRPWAEVPDGLQGRLDLLLPHVAKVVEINRKFTLLRQRYQAALAALDHVRIGTCLTAPTGQVIVANAEALRIFALDDGIGVSKAGFLTCSAQAATASLTSKILAMTATAGGENAGHEVLMFVERRSGGRPFLIEIAPLRDSIGEVEPGLEGAIVFIIDPQNQQAISTRRLATLFSLTEAEADICRHMVGGLSASEIAKVRDVSEDTVKSQFKTVYAKTGVRRRADLVRLALAVDPPIGPA